jgi:hypothetical protein
MYTECPRSPSTFTHHVDVCALRWIVYVKLVGHNLKASHGRHVLNVDIKRLIHMRHVMCVYTFMICLHINLHTTSSNNSLVTAEENL